MGGVGSLGSKYGSQAGMDSGNTAAADGVCFSVGNKGPADPVCLRLFWVRELAIRFWAGRGNVE